MCLRALRGGSGCRQGCGQGHRVGWGGVGVGELAAASRSHQEEGRFESLSDFLLPLLRSGRKLI